MSPCVYVAMCACVCVPRWCECMMWGRHTLTHMPIVFHTHTRVRPWPCCLSFMHSWRHTLRSCVSQLTVCFERGSIAEGVVNLSCAAGGRDAIAPMSKSTDTDPPVMPVNALICAHRHEVHEGCRCAGAVHAPQGLVDLAMHITFCFFSYIRLLVRGTCKRRRTVTICAS